MGNLSPRYTSGARTTTHNDAQTAVDQPVAPRVTGEQIVRDKSVAGSKHSQTTAETAFDHSRRDYWRARIGALLDEAINNALLQLSVMPGNISGRGFEPSVKHDSEQRLPVDFKGRALGDNALADLQNRARKAKRLEAKRAVLDAINEEIDRLRYASREGWADLGTVDGRAIVARHAQQHGRAQTMFAFGIKKSKLDQCIADHKLRQTQNDRQTAKFKRARAR